MLHLQQQVEKEGGNINISENTVKYRDWENRIATPWRFKVEKKKYFYSSQNCEFEEARGALKHEPQTCISSEQALACQPNLKPKSAEICPLLGYYAAWSGNSVPTFRDTGFWNVGTELPLYAA